MAKKTETPAAPAQSGATPEASAQEAARLFRLLRDTDVDIRRSAVIGLARLEGEVKPEWRGVLASHCRSFLCDLKADELLRRLAIRYLSALEDCDESTLIELLLASAAAESAALRREAARAFTRLALPRPVKPKAQ